MEKLVIQAYIVLLPLLLLLCALLFLIVSLFFTYTPWTVSQQITLTWYNIFMRYAAARHTSIYLLFLPCTSAAAAL